jgi:hypothetical protein
MTEEKVLYRNDKLACPHCGKLLDVRFIRKTIEKTVKGTYKRTIQIQKSDQSLLEFGREYNASS